MANDFDPFKFLLELRDALRDISADGEHDFRTDIAGLERVLKMFANGRPLTDRLSDRTILEDVITARNAFAGAVEEQPAMHDYRWNVDILSRIVNERMGVEVYEMLDSDFWKDDEASEDAGPKNSSWP